jgi:hypothetical protein
VWRLQFGQNFFISNRLGVFRRFFIVVYLEIPAERLFVFVLQSVHSSVIITRIPLVLAIVLINGLLC